MAKANKIRATVKTFPPDLKKALRIYDSIADECTDLILDGLLNDSKKKPALQERVNATYSKAEKLISDLKTMNEKTRETAKSLAVIACAISKTQEGSENHSLIKISIKYCEGFLTRYKDTLGLTATQSGNIKGYVTPEGFPATDYADADEATKQKADELYDQLKGFSPKAFETRASEILDKIREQVSAVSALGLPLSAEEQHSVLEKEPLSPAKIHEGVSQRLTVNKEQIEAYTKLMDQSAVLTCMLSKDNVPPNNSFKESSNLTKALYLEIKRLKGIGDYYETRLKEIEKDLNAPKDKPNPKTPGM